MTQMRQITDRYFVSPQIDPQDLSALAAAGITRVICNRPDTEVPPSHQAAAIEEAAKAAGLEFVALPLTHQTMTPENVALQREQIDGAEGAVLAYCASGTRSSVIWALGQTDDMSVDEILSTTAKAGYDLEGLRPALTAAAPA